MPWVTWMQPRDYRDASRTLSLLIVVALTVVAATVPLIDMQRESHPMLLVAAAVAFVVLAGLGAGAWFFSEMSRWAWALAPLVGIAAMTLLCVGTRQASIGVQVFWVITSIYGGALLAPRGVAVMTSCSIAGEALLVFAQLPIRLALTDLLFVSATLITTAYVLGRGSARVAALMAELELRASTDSLTGLVNRGTFDVAIELAMRESTNEVGDPGTSLILVDIDRFKTINDEFGHPGGDEILVQLSELIASVARKHDVVCRLGGDELAVLLPSCPVDVAERRAHEIVETVRDHAFSAGPATTVRVSVSAGLAHAPTDADTAPELYAVADSALYAAKRAGRDQVVQHRAEVA